jgi:serine/threonine protein kinase
VIGTTISHYRITEKLGEGGMGVVYKAEDTELDRPVALKFLAPHLLRDEEGRKRFRREAKASAALDHPNICTVYEIGQADDQHFISMAFLDGRTLSKEIAVGPLKLPEALSIAIQMAEGLEAAHEKGIAHRDIKPDNVMLMKGSRGLVKLMDFGLAQLAESSKLTREGTTLGTPIYMSPEQALGESTDRRSDVWGLGVVLYEMVAGQPPFRGEVDQAVIYAIANEQHEPLTALRTGVPKELERITDKVPGERCRGALPARHRSACGSAIGAPGCGTASSENSPKSGAQQAYGTRCPGCNRRGPSWGSRSHLVAHPFIGSTPAIRIRQADHSRHGIHC